MNKKEARKEMYQNLFASFAFGVMLLFLAGMLSLGSRSDPVQAQVDAPPSENRLPYLLVALHARLAILEQKQGIEAPKEFTTELDSLTTAVMNGDIK